MATFRQKRRTQDLELEDAVGVLAPRYTNQVTLTKSQTFSVSSFLCFTYYGNRTKCHIKTLIVVSWKKITSSHFSCVALYSSAYGF